jgi:murein tripeptide amidase MpaA
MNKINKKGLQRILTVCVAATLLPNASFADEMAHLPPVAQWEGKSVSLINDVRAKLTPAERTDLTATPSYGETVAYIHKLAGRSPYLRLKSIGKSAQGRPIFMMVASRDGKKDAQGILANTKPTVLIQAGIHSGEIDGKDAGLMLMRDIMLGKEVALIQQVNLLFIPILSVDGHERASNFNRVNQRGPENMGWRTNSRNLNLNRDYSKLETPELQAVIGVINEYKPDLYLDIHVTDGEDYQYDITYGYNQAFASQSPNITHWLNDKMSPYLDSQLTEWGHIPGPLVFAEKKKDFKQGISGWTASPRFSNGYGDFRHLPTILVENHSLKPYKQRVLGTYVFIKAAMELVGREKESLRSAIKKDTDFRPKKQVLDFKRDDNPELISFAGISYENYEDKITGQTEVKWLGEAMTYDKLPRYWSRIAKTTVEVPKAYAVPAQYTDVIESLKTHGIEMTTLKRDDALIERHFEQISVDSHEFGKGPYEGRLRVSGTFSANQLTTKLPKGSVIIKTDQPLGMLAVALLEPSGSDSFFSWGYFNTIFQRTEYIENYAVLPLAQAMMAEDPGLKTAFEAKLKADKAFAQDPSARLDFFYKKSPYYDKTFLKYPVLIQR